MNLRLLSPDAKASGMRGHRGVPAVGNGPVPACGVRVALAQIKTGALVSVLGAVLLSGCSSTSPGPAPIVTVTATPSVRVVTFNPATSGRLLAAKIVKRAKTAGMTVTGVECKNFPDLKVGTAADCQMRVKGVKQGLRATFTLREGHFVLKPQKLIW